MADTTDRRPAAPASPSAPPPPPEDDDASVTSSVPSTLYARCAPSTSTNLHARRLKAAVDQDLQFLQNRLAKLRLEEDKAKADIEMLRKKAEEVNHAKMKHSSTATQRRTLRDQVDYGKRKEAALIALNKERQAKAVWASKQRVISDRRETVLAMRKQKEINECRIQILDEEKREKAIKQRETIRDLQRLAKTRREQEAEERREKARSEFEARAEATLREREEKEQLAAQLIAAEAQMIYRLKLLHQEKQEALQNLSGVVVGGGSRGVSPTSQSSVAADDMSGEL